MDRKPSSQSDWSWVFIVTGSGFLRTRIKSPVSPRTMDASELPSKWAGDDSGSSVEVAIVTRSAISMTLS